VSWQRIRHASTQELFGTLLHEFDVESLKGAEFPKQVDRGTISMPPMDVS
jgi:hypothetical protein